MYNTIATTFGELVIFPTPRVRLRNFPAFSTVQLSLWGQQASEVRPHIIQPTAYIIQPHNIMSVVAKS